MALPDGFSALRPCQIEMPKNPAKIKIITAIIIPVRLFIEIIITRLMFCGKI
jgi:hypothetical protein